MRLNNDDKNNLINRICFMSDEEVNAYYKRINDYIKKLYKEREEEEEYLKECKYDYNEARETKNQITYLNMQLGLANSIIEYIDNYSNDKNLVRR